MPLMCPAPPALSSVSHFARLDYIASQDRIVTFVTREGTEDFFTKYRYISQRAAVRPADCFAHLVSRRLHRTHWLLVA